MNGRASVSQDDIAVSWWRALQPRADGRGGDRAAVARLRRAAGIREAAADPATIELCRSLGLGWQGLERVALTAAVLAHVREDNGSLVAARQLGPPDAAMSWLRFRRLMEADTADERLLAFRRAVALAGRRINVTDLARSLLNWNDRQRQRWLYAYHDAPVPTAYEAGSSSNAKDEAA